MRTLYTELMIVIPCIHTHFTLNDLVKFINTQESISLFSRPWHSLLAVQNLCRISHCKWRTHKAWKQGFHINGQLFLLLLVFSLHFREARFYSMLTWAYDEFESRAWSSSIAVVSGPSSGCWESSLCSGILSEWFQMRIIDCLSNGEGYQSFVHTIGKFLLMIMMALGIYRTCNYNWNTLLWSPTHTHTKLYLEILLTNVASHFFKILLKTCIKLQCILCVVEKNPPNML